ncbi:hypothetical protein A9267_08845 [Shewanella sp. UCD-FRSSP16_17]|nr:hypothetical protein A9267_08845 [Shewanella sp. UCD-FRSSP16_17]
MTKGVNYLLLSLPIGISAVLCFHFWNTLNSLFIRLLYLVIGFLCFFGLFYLQSRAVVITVVVFSIVATLIDSSLKTVTIKLIISMVFVFFVFVTFFDSFVGLYESSALFERMNGLITGESSEPRVLLYSDFFSRLNTFYFSGFGMGGTEIALYENTAAKYPHNFILEFISEFGILGGLFSLLITITALLQCVKLVMVDSKNMGLVLFYLFYLMNFMKSFSIYQSTFLFVAFGLLFNSNLHFGKKGKICKC